MEVLLGAILLLQLLTLIALAFIKQHIVELKHPPLKQVTVATPFVVKDDMLKQNLEAIGQAPPDANDTIGKYNPGSWT